MNVNRMRIKRTNQPMKCLLFHDSVKFQHFARNIDDKQKLNRNKRTNIF